MFSEPCHSNIQSISNIQWMDGRINQSMNQSINQSINQINNNIHITTEDYTMLNHLIVNKTYKKHCAKP